MIIKKSIDIEDEIRVALDPYLTVYCRPLPADYGLPHILITQVGGSESQTIDTFAVVLDSRATTEAEALDYLHTAVGLVKQIAKEQTTELRHVTVNSIASWGIDATRPDLAMCSARLEIVAHQGEESVEAKYHRIVGSDAAYIIGVEKETE